MWPKWLKSPGRTTPRPRPLSFSCFSFKDVQTLCQEEESVPPLPLSPKSPSFLSRRIRISSSLLRLSHRHYSYPAARQRSLLLPEGDEHQGIVVYYTSLRIVRKTYEDCRVARSILCGFRAFIDERDVSIDDSFLQELQHILGRNCVSLPAVFIGGVLIGGAEKIARLQETGELRDLIERLPSVKPLLCDCCGGLRFVLCGECNGSHKVCTDKYGFKSCTACNVNGLLRCPSCSFMHLRRT